MAMVKGCLSLAVLSVRSRRCTWPGSMASDQPAKASKEA